MDITIRKAEQKDIESIINYQIKMAQETEGIHLKKGVLTDGVLAVLSDKNKGQYFIADVDHRVVGSFLSTYEWSDWRNGTVLWMQSVYVEPAYRKQGVFKEMFNKLKTMVEKEDHLKGIRLYVDTTNASAQIVYKRMGMENHHYEMFEWMK